MKPFDVRLNRILEQTLAEINAVFDGREFTHLGTGWVLGGWGAWAHYAAEGGWL